MSSSAQNSQGPSDAADAIMPRFLRNWTPTNKGRRRYRPFGRAPLTWRLGDVWHTAAASLPTQMVSVDRPADIAPTSPVDRTYADCASLVDEAASWLYEAGVRPWDRVAIMKNHHFDITILGCAAARIGAIPALMSGTYGPEFALPLLTRLEKPFVVTDHDHLGSCGLDQEAVAGLTARTICVDRGAEEGKERADLIYLDDLRGAPGVSPKMLAFEDPMAITHTSGTTGVPKLGMHSAESTYSVAVVEAEKFPVIGWSAKDTWAYCDPYWHERILTFLLAMTAVNERMVMLSGPNVGTAKELMLKHRPTILEALPNIWLHWEPLAADPERPFGSIRLFLSSFDAIHTRTIRSFLNASDQRMPVWLQIWSQTEVGPMAIRPYWRRSVRKRGHRPPPTQLIGWPIPFFGKMRAVDPETGKNVRRGQVGLIETRQPGRCLAYVGEQHRHDLKCRGEWWNTGDLGVINRLGAVRIVDREIDRIPEGSAIAFEDILLDRLPRTTEVVILPRANGHPVPVYSTVDDTDIDTAEWGRAVADLPPMADPVRIRWDEFPRTGTWKIRRIQLRERLMPDSAAIGIGRWT